MNPHEFLLTRQLRAVYLSHAIEGTVSTLPAGARILIVGPSTKPGFLEVICANVHYEVPEEELRDAGVGQTRTTPTTN